MNRERILQKLGEIFPTLKPLLEPSPKKRRGRREKPRMPVCAPEPPKDAKPDRTEFFLKFPPKFEESGPFHISELRTLARDGMITPETQIRTETSPWMAAASIKGLVTTPVETGERS